MLAHEVLLNGIQTKSAPTNRLHIWGNIMRKYICGFLGIATLTFGCGLSLPQLIPYKTLPAVNNEDSNVEIAMHRCVDRLNSERANARFSRNSSDAIAIIGGVLSAGSGVTSAILSATLPADTIGDDHRGQKVAAASTAGFAAVSALVGLIGKLLENSATPILRRSQAEAHFNLGMKYVQQKKSIAYAMSRFDDCALFTVPPDQKDPEEGLPPSIIRNRPVGGQPTISTEVQPPLTTDPIVLTNPLTGLFDASPPTKAALPPPKGK
ncbi:MAG TPA: hypothetical protein PLA87_24345 [Pseudomonadota bacterium]|nr:hypothetical protein [Pseudomonadota bacterium]